MRETLGVIEGVRGLTYDTIYDLFFMKETVLAATVLHPSDLTELYLQRGSDLSGMLEFFLGGTFTKREAQRRAEITIMKRRKDFKGKSYQELLNTHRANFSLKYSEINKVEVKKSFFGVKLRFHAQNSNGSDMKLDFNLRKRQFQDAKRIVDIALPSKVG